MNKNPLNKGAFTENSREIGLVTPEMVQARARELALIGGRTPLHVSQADYDQAKRELTGGAEMTPQEAGVDQLPQSEEWDPVPGSTGHQVPNSASEDEDGEGQSESAQLVGEGLREANHDQMLQAAREAVQRDREDS